MKKSALLSLISIAFLISQFSTVFAQAAPAPEPGPERRNVSVSALVPPKASDFQFDFSYEGASLVHQDQSINYEIIYGASASAGIDTNNIITVYYSADKAPDRSYIIEYVFGSASRGYGDVQPVVDTKDRTITWKLPPMPNGTMNQKLEFQLRANDKYHDAKRLTFRTRAAMTNEYVILPDYGVQQDYQFSQARVTPGPTATPAPPATPAPTPIPVPLFYKDIALRTITPTSAEVAITTSNPTTTIIQYGTSPDSLSQQAEDKRLVRYKTLQLSGLAPGTRYYMQVISRDKDNVRLRSDKFTFTTASTDAPVVQEKEAYIFTSGDTVLLSNIVERKVDSAGFLLLPTNTGFKLTYTFGTPSSITALEAVIRNDEGILQRVQMTQLDARTYIGQLRTNSQGTYSIEVVQSDDKGNIMSKKLSILKTVSPISVLELDGITPIIDARVFLFSFNKASGQYEAIDNANFKNPSLTDNNGLVHYILLPGKYRAQTRAFGYKTNTIDFTLGQGAGEEFPKIKLARDTFDLFALFTYLKTLLFDSTNYLLESIRNISTSMRAFNNVATTGLITAIALGFMLFTIRTDIKWKDLLPFFVFHLAVLGRNHKEAYIYGKVSDAQNQPISHVRVEAIDYKSGTVLAHTTSNKQGAFHFLNTFDRPYVKLVVTKEDFAKMEMIVPTDKKTETPITLRHAEASKPVVMGLRHIGGELFELVLLLCFVAELLFLVQFGVAKTLPFFILSALNLSLWLFYQKNHK
ncbi:MAG: hypothetical protein H0W89_05460 [Candidatus Levybacteria bacterium]|nr:hypothetical protein [Candidatus Levybacteria bacterium]